MTAYVLRRFGFSIFVLWGALTIVFAAIRLAPGDPAQLILGPDATAEQLAALRERLGLDRPILLQYVQYVAQALRLDFGMSLRLDQPAAQAIAERFGETARLALAAMVLAVLISFPLGIAAALRPRSPIDSLVSVVSLLGQSVPGFWLGIMFILLFARSLRLLPSGGADSWQHLIMPAATLALPLIGVLTRLVRSGMLDVLDEDYIRTARAKGLPERTVVMKHGLRASLAPVVTLFGIDIALLIGGAVITETVFNLQGLGNWAVTAVFSADLPAVLGVTLILSFAVAFMNLIVDLLYAYLDPRVRYT
jgi:peptide/nickel transport system permease protein